MESFSKYFTLNEDILKDNRRHMKPGLTPASMKRFVPKWHQTKVENVKLMKLKQGTSKQEMLSPAEVTQLSQIFKFNPAFDQSVKLGNTGITLNKLNDQKFMISKG